MKEKKTNIVHIAFLSLSTFLIAAYGILLAIGDFVLGTETYGQGTMTVILVALLLVGLVFIIIGEVKKRNDVEMIGLLLNYLSFIILFFTDGWSVGLGVFAGIVLFANLIFAVLRLYMDKKAIKLISLILSAALFLLLVCYGSYGLVVSSYGSNFVIYFFGLLFLGIALFVNSLFIFLESKKATPEQIAKLQELKKQHDEKQLSDADYAKAREEIVNK